MSIKHSALKDRRHHTRHQAKDNLIAFDSRCFGQVENISMGGLLFKVLSSNDYDPPETFKLGLLSSRAETYLESLPCRVVKVSRGNSSSSHNSVTNTLHIWVRFGPLSLTQQKQLAMFIHDNTRPALMSS
ncbi:MAG: PilZ domain-containing protein [Thermodesulfobacteriota bacterium]